MKGKKWTAKEDEILVQAVKDNFDNLLAGFRKVSEETGRTTNAAKERWYKAISNPEHKDYVGSSCFIGFGENKRYPNRKNFRDNYTKQEPEKVTTSLWSKVLKLLGIK